MDTQSRRQNARFHLIEGALYIGSGAFLSPQTVLPALILTLGGGPLIVGALPVVMYLTLLIPQLSAAMHIRRLPYRKPWTIMGGFIQRLVILALSVSVMLAAVVDGVWTLIIVLVLLTFNQLAAGTTSPAWFDFLVKTTETTDRGRLMGLRSSAGAILALMNSLVLTAVLTWLPTPFNFSAVFGAAFVFQMASLLVQRQIVESHPSPEVSASGLASSLRHAVMVLRKDRRFFLFLVSAGFITAGFSSAGFFTVHALNTFRMEPASVGVFTMSMVAAQIVGGVFLGWISDRKGTTIPLLVSAASMFCASIIALIATQPEHLFVVFMCTGVTVGVELISRYNFAGEAAPDGERALYVGIMNAWIAPWYLCSFLAGALIPYIGYSGVFLGSCIFSLIGFVVLWKVDDPRRPRLALSSE